MSIQPASAWDVFVYPSGHHCYRMNKCDHPTEAQVYPVGHPEYKAVVAEMRREASRWLASHSEDDADRFQRIKNMVDFDKCHVEPAMNRDRLGRVTAKTSKEPEPTPGITVHRLGF